MNFNIGDRVVRNPATWLASDFDAWIAPDDVGVVVESPIPVDLHYVDVRWPLGRCWRHVDELLPAGEATAADGAKGDV